MKLLALSYSKFLFTVSFFVISSLNAKGEGGLRLYTPYAKISVPPGQTIDYTIDIYNSGAAVKTANVSVTGLPRNWDYSLIAGGFLVRRISVLPGETKSINLQVVVPLEVNKGNYRFNLVAADFGQLPLTINISEGGTFKTEFTSDQANMQGHSESNFHFQTQLTNRTSENLIYSLQADLERGWSVIFEPNFQQATAVEVAPNAIANIRVQINPPHNVEAGTYKIPIRAINQNSSAELILEVVITGTFGIELTTPTGLLSSDITAGREKRVELLIRNTGSSPLSNVQLTASAPANWEVVFEPDSINHLNAGVDMLVYATIRAFDQAIPGDYATRITARTNEVSSEATFRMSVKTPLLWGWLGIFIVLAALGFIYFLFRKYGRR